MHLTDHEITLIRVALLQRCNRLKSREDMRDSYEASLALLERLWKARQGLHGCREDRELAREWRVTT